jgi:hypothetical protein
MNSAVVIAIQDWLDRRDAGHLQGLFEETADAHRHLLDRLAGT